MSQEKFVRQTPAIGAAVTDEDFALIGKASALADDRVFDEILRPAPYNGFVPIRWVVPGGSVDRPLPLVTVSGSADNSITVSPFRAFVGSRTLNATSPTLAWQDSISGVYVPQNSTYKQTFALAANALGTVRVDAVVATVYPDAPGATVSRKAKDPTTGVVTVQSLPVTTYARVDVSVVTGTGTTPPTVSDVAGPPAGYSIILAYIYVPAGATTTTTLSRFAVLPMAIVRQLRSPAAHDMTAEAFRWGASTARPDKFIPNQFQGFATKIVRFGGTSLQVLDQSIDWRDRIFQVVANFTDTTGFGGSHRSPWPSATFPTRDGLTDYILGSVANGGVTTRHVMAQSFHNDYYATGGVDNASMLVNLEVSTAETKAAIFVDRASGQLAYWPNSLPFEGLAIIHYSAQFPNAI